MRCDARIPLRGKAKHVEAARQIFAGVIADDDERRAAILVGYGDGRRFIGREEAGRRAIHAGFGSFADAIG